jgi:ankyrin repeat protein
MSTRKKQRPTRKRKQRGRGVSFSRSAVPVVAPQPLHEAVLHENIETVKALIQQGADVNTKSNKGDRATPLYFATLMGNINIIKLLLEAGADPNIENIHGSTPFFEACLINGNPKIIKLMFLAGADIHKKYNNTLIDAKYKNKTIPEMILLDDELFVSNGLKILELFKTFEKLEQIKQTRKNLNRFPKNVLGDLPNEPIYTIASFYSGKKGSINQQKQKLAQNEGQLLSDILL